MKRLFAGLALLALCGAVVTLAAVIDDSSRTRIKDRAAVSPGETASIDKATLDARLARLEGKRLKGPKDPYNQPAEAIEFYLMQRTGGEPLDYRHIELAKGEVAAMPHATITSSGVVIHEPGEDISSRAVGDITGWTELGPGNIGGRTRSLLIDPAAPNTMYAGAVAGGVWKTTDGGSSWAKLDDLMTNLAVSTMAFEGNGSGGLDSTTIYAGTGEGFFNIDSVRGAGIFKSADSGATWSQLTSTNNSDFHYVNKIGAYANAAGTLYAATSTGVWKTTNGGTSWTSTLANTGFGGSNDSVNFTVVGFTDVEIEATNGTIIASNGSFFSDGIYRSSDGGGSWSQVHTVTGIGRSDLIFAPSNADVAYAISADADNGHRLLNIYRSSDNGATWSAQITSSGGAWAGDDVNWLLLTNGVIANFSACFPPGSDAFFHQGWYDNVIAVAPDDENVVYAGGIDLFRSDDGGANWGVISYWWVPTSSRYAHADQHTIQFHPGWDGSANQTLFVGNDGGIFKSTDAMGSVASGGKGSSASGICFNRPVKLPNVNWTALNNGYNVTQFYHGRPLGSTTSYMGGTQDNGTLLGSDAGGINAWTEEQGGDGGYVSFDPDDLSTRFAEFTGLSITRQYQGGAFEGIVADIAEGPGNFLFISPFRHDPSDRDRMWTGGFFPWRSSGASTSSTAGGVTWTLAGTITEGFGSISAWAVDPNDSDNVWLGLSDGVVQSTDVGTTSTSNTIWIVQRDGFFGSDDWNGFAYTSWIEIDGNDATGDTVYLTNSMFGALTTKVFRTTNGGTSWSDITNNLPDIPVHCVVVQPGNASNIFLGTDLGVFVSQDGGSTWASMNQSPDFTNTVVEALEFQDSATLYAFTHGRSAWRATVSDTIAPFSPVYVDASHGGPFQGTLSNPFADLQDGIDNVSSGGIINIAGGTYDITTPQTITKISTWSQNGGGTVVVQ